MSSTVQHKDDSRLRLVSDEDAVAFPDDARPTDDTPTVISKTMPIVEPSSSNKDKIVDLSRKPTTPEAIVAGLRGQRLAHYELIEPIGVGGMAAVIRAKDTQLDRMVALKILPPEMAQEKDNIQRFHQEAKAAAKLDHENIARVFYCGEDQGLFFIAFEFVDGMNLRTLMERRGRIPVPEAVGYVLQIAAGLEHAANRGVVHRDVKPSNIIITPDGQAKLVDMGLARNLERRGERDLTQSGVTLGTFDYISPEQALEPREADSRSDIYSLGCTLYHMLTGQPPVPEGTPAKKLQHHQHHSPIDPRELNPSVPDEIVRILGKMMAKNPKDRYQKPIHLVHHLMQVAQKVGVAGDLPEVLLFMDSSLPSQPRTHPFLMIGMALAFLAAMTVVWSLATDPTPARNQGNTYAGGPKDAPVNPDSGPPKAKDTPKLAGRPEVIKKVEDLHAVFSDNPATEIHAHLDGTIDLKNTGTSLTGAPNQKLILEPKVVGNFHTVRFEHLAGASAHGLLLEGAKEIVFRRIRFLILSDTTPDSAVAMLMLRGVTNVKFEYCIFAQENQQKISPDPKQIPIASILIDSSEDEPGAKPTVSFEACLFEGDNLKGGQVAVAVNGPAVVNLTNCAFKAHGAFFHFRDECTLKHTRVNMAHCNGFVVNGPAFRFDARTSAHLSVNFSAFLTPDATPSPDPGLPDRDLISLGDDRLIQFEGQRNLYRLNALVRLYSDEDGFQKFLGLGNGKDQNSKYLNQSDVLNNPWQPKDQATNEFQLKYEYQDIGLQRTWTGALMPKLPPPVFVSNQPHQKIVDPDTLKPGEFRSLSGALGEAKSGDVILIKHGKNREVVVPQITLNPDITVTLRPFEGYQPILVLPKADDKDSTFFKMQKSTLHLEKLEILLDPEEQLDTRSVVHLGEAATLVFDKCTLTLRATNLVDLSVVTFIDRDMMKLDTSAGLPSRVEFRDCFIRGKGDLVALRGCRKMNVVMTHSLVALEGSLLDIKAAEKAMPMDQGVQWNMANSSIFTTESIFTLRSSTGKGLTQTQAKVDKCLFVSLDAEQDLVFREKRGDLEKFLMWKGDQNFFANFDKSKMSDWKDKYSEVKSESADLTFPKLSDETVRILWDATPDWFLPTDPEQLKSIAGYGKTLE